MNNIEYKEALINTGIFKRKSAGQYVCKSCPYCGDNKNHMYVKIDITDDSPVMFHCFKCLKSGIVNKEFLRYYNIENIKIPNMKTVHKIQDPNKATVSVVETFNEHDNLNGVKNYIYSRIGVIPTNDDLKSFQYIGNPNYYVKTYLNTDNNFSILNNRFWFRLTNGNIIGRYKNDETNNRWMKYKASRIRSTSLYSIKQPFDVLQPINVYIVEGVMDAIGLYYHYIRNNNIYIAVCGKDYQLGLSYLIDTGIFGKSVNIKIIKDNDVNQIFIDSRYRKLFNKIEIYHNTLSKDCGVCKENIDIRKCL